jgi:septum formation protein
MSGRAHVVLTGVALAWRGQVQARAARTVVWMDALSDADIAAYVQSGEPMDKAGAYAIQGLASRFVSRIDGSYGNVVGLPIALVWSLLREAGVTSR